MSDVANTDKIEISEQKTRNYVLYGALVGLLILVQGFFTYVITSTANEMRETNRTLNDMVTNVKVGAAQMDFLRQQVADLQTAKKEAGAVHTLQADRLNSLEQRVALHDQWIQAHNH